MKSKENHGDTEAQRPSIVINEQVRSLLVDLADLIEKDGGLTAKLADPSISNSEAVAAGFDREQIRSAIIGCAWRLNRASLGLVYRDGEYVKPPRERKPRQRKRKEALTLTQMFAPPDSQL